MKQAITSSGPLTTATQVLVGPGRIHGLIVLTDGTNLATVNLYDSEDSNISGKLEVLRKRTAGTAQTQSVPLPEQGIEVNRGIRLAISGTGAVAIVLYSPN